MWMDIGNGNAGRNDMPQPYRKKTMSADGIQYAYGPVPSRRLGKSLGINNIPAKVCTYACVYCQVGKTSRLVIERGSFYDPLEIVKDVQFRIVAARKAAEKVDYLTFVPDGEPTVDRHLNDALSLLKPAGIPLGVITNSSLAWRADVRAALRRADWVSLKIDAVDETVWRRINRPHKALKLTSILNGILEFARTFTGRLVTETMLVKGVNDGEECLKATSAFVKRVRPHTAYLSVPTRPPVEKWVRAPDEITLTRAFHLFAENEQRVEYLIAYEGNAFAFFGDVEKDLIGITAVHPMRQEAVKTLLSRAGASWEVVDRLIRRGELVETHYAGHCFYLRKMPQAPSGL
jgi:wyosine [tRNA(Phe)-imidazoG37] synthetase (radical SAM superfamily)